MSLQLSIRYAYQHSTISPSKIKIPRAVYPKQTPESRACTQNVFHPEGATHAWGKQDKPKTQHTITLLTQTPTTRTRPARSTTPTPTEGCAAGKTTRRHIHSTEPTRDCHSHRCVQQGGRQTKTSDCSSRCWREQCNDQKLQKVKGFLHKSSNVHMRTGD